MPQWQERIALGKIAGDTTFGNIVFYDLKIAHFTLNAVVNRGCQSNGLAFYQTEAVDVITMHQDHVARAIDTAEPVIVIINRCVKLTVAAQGNQLQYVTLIRPHIDIR